MAETNIWEKAFHHIEKMETHQELVDSEREGRDKEIAMIYTNGVGVSEIARRLGLTRTTILRVLEFQGVK